MDDIRLAYHDDGKCKLESHEVYLQETKDFYHDIGLWSRNIFEVTGLGATKEEALEDLKKKLEVLFNELKSLENKILNTDFLCNDNMIDVDCFGKEIVKRG